MASASENGTYVDIFSIGNDKLAVGITKKSILRLRLI